jgi:uncharacterized protein
VVGVTRQIESLGRCSAIKRIIWRRIDGTSIEFCTFRFEHGTKISGRMIGDFGGMLSKVDYEIECATGGTTKSVSVSINSLHDDFVLDMTREPSGIWTVNGQKRSDLAACMDVDIGVTPASNSLPIRRLHLEIGQSRELVAAWLRFPDLRVAPMRQRYTRTGENTYIYESVDSGYKAELTVNEDGIVQTYDGEWRVAVE